jgi:hypothetical protein
MSTFYRGSLFEEFATTEYRRLGSWIYAIAWQIVSSRVRLYTGHNVNHKHHQFHSVGGEQLVLLIATFLSRSDSKILQ